MSCGCTQEGWRVPTRAVPPRPSCWRSSINSHAARLFFSFLFYTACVRSDDFKLFGPFCPDQADDEFNFICLSEVQIKNSREFLGLYVNSITKNP